MEDIEFPDHPDVAMGVQMLIGSNLEKIHVSQEEREPKMGNGPVARRTRLGWSAIGRLRPGSEMEKEAEEVRLAWGLAVKQAAASATIATPSADSFLIHSVGDTLEEKVDRMMAIDELIDRPKPMSRDEKRAEAIVSEGKMKDGKMEVGCLWKSDERPKTNNIALARKRLSGLELGKIFNSEEEEKQYWGKFEAWEEKDYIKKADTPTNEGYYIPHFPVIKYSEDNELKIRPVMDCSAKFKGECLNQYMTPGRNLLVEITKVLMRFRKNSVALSADAAEMFLQIKMPQEDQKYHKFLLKNKEGREEAYQFKRHLFGSVGSVNVAVGTVRNAAESFKERYPRAAEMILDSSLVDDNLDSFNTIEEAQRVAGELREIMASVGIRCENGCPRRTKS